jgi:nucleoside phosphorylase
MDGTLVKSDCRQWRSVAIRRAILIECLLSRLHNLVIVALAVSACACGTEGGDSPPPRLAVLTAFPAELAPFIEKVTIDDTMILEGRVFRTGMLERAPVVLGLTGIGLANAAMTTRAVLERFNITGVVVSGVAGSSLRIGDVAVPAVWTLREGATYTAHREWLELVDEIAGTGNVSLEHCTRVPFAPSRETVCLPHEPAVVVGGVGESNDPFGHTPFPCLPVGGDVFGCDVVLDTACVSESDRHATRTLATVTPEAPIVNDMETAAIAHEAAVRGLPFIAFRAVSDGAGDPLGLPGFPAQFFLYYRLAARNAAAATVAFLERVAHGADTGRRRR